MSSIKQCKCNANVECLEQTKCSSCGWNPDVAQERLLKRIPSATSALKKDGRNPHE